jgi:hypothetical protein
LSTGYAVDAMSTHDASFVEEELASRPWLVASVDWRWAASATGTVGIEGDSGVLLGCLECCTALRIARRVAALRALRFQCRE